MAKSIADVLAQKGVLTQEAASGMRREAKSTGRPLEDIFYQHGIPERDVALAKSELLGIPARFLEGGKVEFEILRNIPEESAKFYKFIPIEKSGDGSLEIGMVNPDDVNAQEALKFIATRLNIPFKIFIITPGDLKAVLTEYKTLGGEVTRSLTEFEKELEVDVVGRPPRAAELEKMAEEAPITKMVGVILRHAVEGKASDIHIEPEPRQVRVRFRVDGVLHTTLVLPSAVQSAIISRIKIMTNMKIDETRIPQDGRFHARVLDREIDFRVATFPAQYGEKAAIRILDPAVGIKTLPELGIDGRNLEVVERSIRKPFGLVLLTGPTGSGKSSTLYAILNILNKEGVNIVSLEDPVEYYISGVNQSQVRPEIGYDFSSGLRQILRQDPDIIMVGEIRDRETAQLAIHAALTGHLVLSTLHTNNAVGVIPRLVDLGVEPFLIPSTLILAVAQRLVRTLCPDSKKEVKLEGRAKELIGDELAEMPESARRELEKLMTGPLYEGEVSSFCPMGTKGRIGVFEALEMTPQLEKIILSGPTEFKLAEEAKKQGMITLRQDGFYKALKGVVGMKELLEVV
ncbi:MAG: type II/IV secretion system protein [Candidatus Sungbacteria bacterium]|nr:type II/IV secretion system protein [Candidatus Sungbacteria bacterium]